MRDGRYGAAGGLLFVALSLVGGATMPQPPSAGASAAEIGRYFGGHQHRIEVAGATTALAALGLLVLIAYLHARLATDPLASRLVLASGSVLVTIAVVGALFQAMIAQVADRLNGQSLVLAFAADRAIFYAGPPFGVLLLAAAVARAAVTAGLPSWLAGLSAVLAVVALVGGVGQLISTSSAFGAVGLAGFLLTVAWAAATSITLLREDAPVLAAQSVA